MLLGTVTLLAAACPPTAEEGIPDGSTEVPDAGEVGDGCVSLELGRRDFAFNVYAQLTGMRFAVKNGIDGTVPEHLLIELFDSTTPGGFTLEAGTFPLGDAPNDSLATCQHCVWVPIDWEDRASLPKRIFIATEGSLTLTKIEDPLTEIIAGSTTEILLREASVDENGATTLVEGGRCARAPALTFDTTPEPGRACLSVEDCANPILEVCSPASNTCVPPECADFAPCPEERPVCLAQYGDRLEGACYAQCDSTVPGGCGEGSVCLQHGVDPAFGICKWSGALELGQACVVEDTSTSCVPGLKCSAITGTCTRTCNFFDGEPGCQADHVCTLLGVCDPVSSGAADGLGQSCGADAELAQGCAANGRIFEGICFAWKGPLICEKTCFDDSDCAANQFCGTRFSSGVGVCVPNPVCGDGKRGEINEACDDGNTDSGDGCSSDCKVVEYNVLCENAARLPLGATTAGNTLTAMDGFFSGCQRATARSDVYRFDPPSRGRLRLTLSSPTIHAVSVRAGCANPGDEVACSSTIRHLGDELIYQVKDDTVALTVLVSADTFLEEGPYTLTAEFIAESCGDGTVAGLEVCDDGNTNSNDGCSSDCSAIEHDAICALAPVLTSSLTGDTTGMASAFEGSCAGSVVGDGPDQLFRYTAPSSGTLVVRLEPDDDQVDLVLSVFEGCGVPSSMKELGCSSVYGIERVQTPVTAGQTVTILVEGWHPYSQGSFTVSAEVVR